MDLREAFRAAIRNVASHGDTDIFPFPFENHLFYDTPDKCAETLEVIHANFEEYMAAYPPDTIVTLSQVGYTGFRWATMIEPFWNAYYLALILQLADQIEAELVSEDKKEVFSYRFSWDGDTAKFFKDLTWRDYKDRCLYLSEKQKYVVMADIADFYTRINHHRIQNALNRLPSPGDSPSRIMRLLTAFSKNVSYGLPIGGPASRILAELALTSVDRHLSTRHITFCRYADDFCLFCSDKSEAYKLLVFLSEKLFNEGLILQKNKTRILSSDEYRESSKAFIPLLEGEKTSDEIKLLNISIRFDPYSPTAEEDYEKLKAAVSDVDIIGILGREVAKAAIDPTISKQAINAVRALDPYFQAEAIRTILDRDNLQVLSPVFVTILRLVRTLYNGLNVNTKDFVDNVLIELYAERFPLLSVELNLSYFIQVIGLRYSQVKEEILVALFEDDSRPLIRRLVILILANWKCHYWLTDLKLKYAGLSSWEKRAFILASYILGDEGRHWRDHVKKAWSPMDICVRDWFAPRFIVNSEIPI
jgi:hypothetical protein